MSDTPTRDQNKFLVRMPDGMRDQIKRLAEINKRSMNTEFVALLEYALWNVDFDRMENGLEPIGVLTDVDRDRIALAREDRERVAAQRKKTLAAHGVDVLLADLLTRLERIEKKVSES